MTTTRRNTRAKSSRWQCDYKNKGKRCPFVPVVGNAGKCWKHEEEGMYVCSAKGAR